MIASTTPGWQRRGRRLVVILAIAIGAGLVSSIATYRLLRRLPPEISRTEFLSEVEQRHVAKVVITDGELISGTSSARGAFRVRMRVDGATVNELRSHGVVVEYETGPD